MSSSASLDVIGGLDLDMNRVVVRTGFNLQASPRHTSYVPSYIQRGGAGHQAPLISHIPISNPKGHMKGVLLAQTMLSRQATKKRQAQQRCFRERRGKSKRGYTSYVEGEEMERSQRVRLISRPMQQNVFWDEFEGRILDVREMLQPSPQLTDSNMGDMSDKPPMANGIRPEVEDQKCEGLGKESHHKDPHTPKSITNLDPQLIETVQRFCNTNMKLP